MIKSKPRRLAYLFVAEKIAEKVKAGRFAPHEKLPTERDLCDEYDVSHITVRRAMQHLADKGLLERKRGSGTFIAEKTTHARRDGYSADEIIAIVVPDIQHSFYGGICRSILSAAESRAKTAVIAAADANIEREGFLINKYIERGIKDIIVFPWRSDAKWYEDLPAQIRIVFVDAAPSSERIPCVTSDDEAGAFALTNYLLSLGHERILFIDGEPKATAHARCRGYSRAVGKANEMILAGSFQYERALSAMRRFLTATSDIPTAMIGCNDTCALGVIAALAERGIRVPDDVSVAGYGNTEPGRYADLTTVDQKTAGYGEMCFAALDTYREGARSISLTKPELIVRTTTAARRAVPPANGNGKSREIISSKIQEVSR
ncbi:MAG: GntR family transcriptional regulator [Spirochaetota bacterium]